MSTRLVWDPMSGGWRREPVKPPPQPVQRGPRPGPKGDPLGRWCPEHEEPYADCGTYSVCPTCYREASERHRLGQAP